MIGFDLSSRNRVMFFSTENVSILVTHRNMFSNVLEVVRHFEFAQRFLFQVFQQGIPATNSENSSNIGPILGVKTPMSPASFGFLWVPGSGCEVIDLCFKIFGHTV